MLWAAQLQAVRKHSNSFVLFVYQKNGINTANKTSCILFMFCSKREMPTFINNDGGNKLSVNRYLLFYYLQLQKAQYLVNEYLPLGRRYLFVQFCFVFFIFSKALAHLVCNISF